MKLRKFILCLLFLAFGASPLVASEAKLYKAEVIRIANEAAQKDGRDLKKYEAPEAHFEYVHKDDTWFVFYQGKHPRVGNHFSVRIHDKTKKTVVIPGM